MPRTESTAQMTESWGKWVVEYRKKRKINSQNAIFASVLLFGLLLPDLLSSLAASYFTSSFPCHPLVKEGKFTKIIFPLLVHYVTVLRVLSGLPRPRFGCHLKTQQFFQPFLLSQVSILIPSNDRVWEKPIFPMETLRKQQKDENCSVWRISRHIFLKSRGQLDSNSR